VRESRATPRTRRAGSSRRTGAASQPAILIDLAQDIIRGLVPAPSEERFDQAVRDTIAECLAKGLTGAHEPGLDLSAIASYTRLIERGQFPFRVFAALSGKKAWGRYATAPRDGGRRAARGGRSEALARRRARSRGAALHSPYCDDPANTGLVLVPPEDVERLTREVSARGFHVWVHAIGDRANTMVLDVFRAGARRRRSPHRCGRARPDPHARRHPALRAPGRGAEHAAHHCTSDMRWAAERLGPERLAGAYAWRSVLDSGAYIAGGSDFPWRTPTPSTASTPR